MNYTIKYPGQSASVGRATPQGQIVLTQPSTAPTLGHHVNGNGQFPMMMQMNSSSGPVFYTYPDGMALNTTIQSKSNESSSNSSISQVVLSPMQTGLDILENNSPNIISGVSISHSSEPKSSTAQSLEELFTVQNSTGIHAQPPAVQSSSAMHNQTLIAANSSVIQSQFPIIQNSGVPPQTLTAVNQSVNHKQAGVQGPSEIANMLTLFQLGGVQIVDGNCAVNPNARILINSSGSQTASEQTVDKEGTLTFIKSLQDNAVISDSKVPSENLYKLLDGSGNVSFYNWKS